MALRGSKYRDKERLRKTRNEQRRRYYNKTSVYERREWTSSEIEMIMKREITDTELSKEIKRSVSSIQMKRYRIKKLMEEKPC